MIEVLLKSAVCLGVGGLLAQRVVRSRPSAAHLIWVAVFVGAILVPLLTIWIEPRAELNIPIGQSARESTQTPPWSPQSEEPQPGGPDTSMPLHSTSNPMVFLLWGAWALGALVVAFRYLRAWSSINRIRRSHSTLIGPGGLRIDPGELACRIGISQNWELRQSATPDILTAMTWGVIHPVVLLPHDADKWPAERLEAVLLHEFAHVRRRDFVSQLLAEAVCALYWFNPLAWFGARAMREAAESAADDAVVRSGVKASDYATQLLQLAAEIGQRSRAYAQVGVSVMSQPKIESRLRSVLSPGARHRGMTSVQALSTCAFVSLSLVAMAALKVSSSSPAQDEAQEAMQRAKHLALGTHIYCTDYDDRMPYAQNTASAMSVIRPYVKEVISFRSPTRGARFEFNLNVGGVLLADIKHPAETPLWVEWLPNRTASAISFVDGHARLLGQADQRPLLKELSRTFPRDAVPLPKNHFPSGKIN